MSVDDIPWNDADALYDRIAGNPAEVTPLMLERLFEHSQMEHRCDVPTRTSVQAALWLAKDRRTLKLGATYAFIVYYDPLVAKEEVAKALTMLKRLTHARRPNNLSGG